MNSKPLYLQLADRVMNDIASGALKDDERIPSVREFAADNQVNVNTAMKAFDYLSSCEIIFTKRGMGYYVKPGASAIVSKLRREEFFQQMNGVFAQLRSFGMTPDELSSLYADFLKK